MVSLAVFLPGISIAVTHDDQDKIIPQILVRFKGASSSLNVSLTAYNEYDETSPTKWKRYSQTASGNNSSSSVWKVIAITMGNGIPVDMVSDLRVWGNNVTTYEVFINVPDPKYETHLDGVRRRKLTKTFASPGTFDNTMGLLLLHGGRTGFGAGKAEMISAGGENLRLGLGHGWSGKPLGHLSFRKRWEPWIADASFETFVYSVDDHHFQVISPAIAFDIVAGATSYDIKGYDRKTQPGTPVVVGGVPVRLDFSAYTYPLIRYTMSYSLGPANPGNGQYTEDVYTFTRGEGVHTMQAKTTLGRKSYAIWDYVGGYCLPPSYICGSYGCISFPPICIPPMAVQTIPGTQESWLKLDEWTDQQQLGGPHRIVEQYDNEHFQGGYHLDKSSHRYVYFDTTPSVKSTAYSELSLAVASYLDTQSSFRSVYWRTNAVYEDGYSSAQFIGSVGYTFLGGTYGDTSPLTVGAGGNLKMSTRVHPGGSWERFTYDDNFDSFGMVKTITVPFKALPATPASGDVGALVTQYTYAADWDGSITQPATVVTTLKGATAGADQIVSKRTFDYSGSYLGQVGAFPANVNQTLLNLGVSQGDIDVQASTITDTASRMYAIETASSPYTMRLVKLWVKGTTDYASASDVNGLTSTVAVGRADDYPWLVDMPFYEIFPDGRKEVYVYQAGTVDQSYNFLGDSFPTTEARNVGKWFRSIKIRGYSTSVAGGSQMDRLTNANCIWFHDPIYVVPWKSTAEVKVTDCFGRLFSEETWALISGGWRVTSKTVLAHDPAGNVVEKKKLAVDGAQYVYQTVFQAQYMGINGDSLNYSSISFDNSYNGYLPTGRKQYERGEDGIIKKFYYDNLGRVAKVVELAPPPIGDAPAIPAMQVVYEYDADNRVLATVKGPVVTGLNSDANALRTEKKFNTAGMVTQSKDPAGRIVDLAFLNGGRTVTKTARGLSDSTYDRVTIRESYLDGKMQSVSGNAVIPRFFDYSATGGQILETAYEGSATSSMLSYAKTYKDWMGRTVRLVESNPLALGDLQTDNIYNPTTGQLTSTATVGLAVKRYKYEIPGLLTQAGLDLNGSGDLEPASTDRLALNASGFGIAVFDGINTVVEIAQNAEYTVDGSAASYIFPSQVLKRSEIFQKQSVSLLGTSIDMWVDSDVVVYDAANQQTRRISYLAPTLGLALKRTTSSLYSGNEDKVYLNGKLVCSIDPSGVRQDYVYDAYGRLSATIDRKGTASISYRAGTGEKQYVKSADNVWTQYEYDPAGRIAWTKQFNGKSATQPASGAAGRYKRFQYNLRGQLERTWGDMVTPVQNIYFEAANGVPEVIGLLKEQITYNADVGWAAATWPASPGVPNRTEFAYYPENGLLRTETRYKAEDATTQITTYTYNALGRLATRVDPRSITTTYGYKTGSGELESVAYSPSGSGTAISFTYDRMGSLKTVSDASGTRTFAYRASDHQLDYEDLPSSIHGTGCRLTFLYDGFNRDRGQQYTAPNVSGSGLSTTYTFSPVNGRLNGVVAPLSATAFGYTYKPNSHLVESITCSGLPISGDQKFSIVKGYEPDLDRLNSTVTSATGREIANYGYQFDQQDRLWIASRRGEVFQYYGTLTEQYGYDDRDQLKTASTTATPASTAIGLSDRALTFDYDNTGNRNYAERGGRRTTYAPNTLGQYESRSSPATMPMAGLVMTKADVKLRNTASGNTAVSATSLALGVAPASTTPANYYFGEVGYSGSAGPVTLETDVSCSTKPITTEQQTLVARAASESFQFDAGGNMTRDSLWDYDYDAENRLVEIRTLSSLPSTVARKKLVFTYDYLSRRVKKEVYDGNSSGTTWTLSDTRCYVYDDWNLILEQRKTGGAAPVPVTYYAWGLDHSGTLRGSGGVGGLLGMVTGLDTASPKTYCAIGDGLGNVTGLMDGQDGKLVASYEYTPFGELIRAVGPMAAQNTIRFSSKMMDVESGFVNFGFRYYSPGLGRFINRDPKDEQGWANIFSDLAGRGGASWNHIGELLKNVHEARYGGEDASMPHTSESGGGYKNSTQTSAPLLDKKQYASSIGGVSDGMEGSGMPGAPAWSHPYGYLDNDPMDDVEYLGLWGENFGMMAHNFQTAIYRGMEGADRMLLGGMFKSGMGTITGQNVFSGAMMNRSMAFDSFMKSAAINSAMMVPGVMRMGTAAAMGGGRASSMMMMGGTQQLVTRSAVGMAAAPVAGSVASLAMRNQIMANIAANQFATRNIATGLARMESKAAATATSQVQVNRTVGNAARDAIASSRPGSLIEQNRMVTGGYRRIDVLDGTKAIESKVGRTSLGERGLRSDGSQSRVRQELARDVKLMRKGYSVEWHFSRSPTTGQIGPTAPLRDKLNKFGIPIVEY